MFKMIKKLFNGECGICKEPMDENVLFKAPEHEHCKTVRLYEDLGIDDIKQRLKKLEDRCEK